MVRLICTLKLLCIGNISKRVKVHANVKSYFLFVSHTHLSISLRGEQLLVRVMGLKFLILCVYIVEPHCFPKRVFVFAYFKPCIRLPYTFRAARNPRVSVQWNHVEAMDVENVDGYVMRLSWIIILIFFSSNLPILNAHYQSFHPKYQCPWRLHSPSLQGEYM